MQNRHGYTNNTVDTITAVLGAGVDLDCGPYMQRDTLAPLLEADALNDTLVDAALARLYRTQFRLGFFDPRAAVPFAAWGAEVVDTPEHRARAREAADQSLVHDAAVDAVFTRVASNRAL